MVATGTHGATATVTVTPTASSTSTQTPIPTNTPRPPITVDFYLLRIEYRVTSDWATIEFRDPQNILSIRQAGISCGQQACSSKTSASISNQMVQVGRPLEVIDAEPFVLVTVDLALTPDTVKMPFIIRSGHGAIRGSGFKVSSFQDGQWVLLSDIGHFWVDPSNPDTSAANFAVDLQALATAPGALQHGTISRPDKLVLAFYYPWFPDYGWSDNTPMSDRPLIDISSTDLSSVAWQIDQARSAGIDAFIMSFNSDWADDRARVLLDAAEEKGFKVSLYLETLNSGGPAWPPATLEEWIRRAYRRFASSPAFLKVDGKPVMFIYSSQAVPLQTWQEMFTRMRTDGVDFIYIGMGYDLANLSVFDGVHDYAIYGYEDLAATYQEASRGIRNYQLLSLQDNPSPKIWAATISPGFNSIPYQLAVPHDFSVERGDGAFYQSTIQAAFASDPDWIVITSWNEYGENTHIEPSQRDGTTFLDLTRQFVEEWKNIRLSP